MKLTYIAHIRLPTDRAHGYAIMKMCEQFAAAGADVELVVPRRKHGIKHDPFEYYRIKRNFKIRRLWATDLLGRFEGSRLAFAIDEATFLLSVRQMKFKDEIVYTRDYQVALLVRSPKIALEVHSIPARTQLFNRALARVRRVITISLGLKRELEDSHKESLKEVVPHIAPDAVDLSEFSVTPDRSLWDEFGIDATKKIALYTGHFYGWKGGDTFAKAGNYVSKDTQLVLMGGVDSELAEFKEKYSKENVHIIGFQPREKIAKIMMSADVLILPNNPLPKISSIYTSPLKLFQYMASGVPIVASDLPSIREILNDETTFWFHPGNSQSLANQIEYAIAHEDEAKAKAEKANEEVKQYTWEKRADNILKCVSSI